MPVGMRPPAVRSGCAGREFGPETPSVCFAGTDVVSGTGTAVVIATGAETLTDDRVVYARSVDDPYVGETTYLAAYSRTTRTTASTKPFRDVSW
jgi:hypothetical protein